MLERVLCLSRDTQKGIQKTLHAESLERPQHHEGRALLVLQDERR